ncbi:MAG: sensor histidine kinase [Clostridia bacterium]
MFEKTRRKLTLFYGGIAALLLLIMVFCFYFSLTTVISLNERSRLQTLTEKLEREWHENRNPDKKGSREKASRPPGPHKEHIGRIDWDFLQPTQFSYILDRNQAIAFTSLKERQLGLLEEVQGFLETHDVASGEMERFHFLEDGVRKTYVLYKAPPLADEVDSFAVYFGEEITGMDELLRQMQLLLSIAAILLVGLATIAGYIFAGRAMIPINQAYKRQKDFTVDASHELRTPLSVMLSSSEILVESKASLPPFHQSVLTGMMDEISRMIRMVENLLSLARNDSEDALNTPEMIKWFDLRQMAVDVLTQMHGSATQKGVQLSLADESTSSPLLYHGNMDQIRQLLYILIDNGIKYTDAEGTVSLSVAPVKHKKVKITVQDRGCGIPEEDIPHIFERFYRIDKGRSRLTGGTGLGLAIAAQIVNAHRGKIIVTSKWQQGTTFTVLLKDV